MRHTLIVLGLTAGLGFASAALAVGEEAVTCELAYTKLSALEDKLYWKGASKGCKEAGPDTEADMKAQEKMDKAALKWGAKLAKMGGETVCDPDDTSYDLYGTAGYWFGSTPSDDYEAVCDGAP